MSGANNVKSLEKRRTAFIFLTNPPKKTQAHENIRAQEHTITLALYTL